MNAAASNRHSIQQEKASVLNCTTQPHPTSKDIIGSSSSDKTMDPTTQVERYLRKPTDRHKHPLPTLSTQIEILIDYGLIAWLASSVCTQALTSTAAQDMTIF